MFSHYSIENIPPFTFYGEERTMNDDNKVLNDDIDMQDDVIVGPSGARDAEQIIESYNRFKE
jgi:hypothetical protein